MNKAHNAQSKFCVVYEFEVPQENEQAFQEVWNQLTHIIKETRGGLGSRLHKDMTRNNIWIAYAQWPSKEAWNSDPASYDAKHSELRTQMKDLCASIRTVYELDVIDDLLVKA